MKWINIVHTYCILMYMFAQTVCVCACALLQSVNKIDDRFPSTVRWFLHRSEIAAGLWEELGDQLDRTGLAWQRRSGSAFSLWVDSLRMISHFLMLAHHPHRTASPPTRPPHCILPGSELNHRGLTNQTTHAKANGEEKDDETGVCCSMSNALQGRGGEGSWAEVFWWGILPYSKEIPER